MNKLLLIGLLSVNLYAQDIAESGGYLIDIVCNKDTSKDYYTIDVDEESDRGWRIIQIIKPYVMIAYWNRVSWFDCYPCLIKVKDSFWTDGDYQRVKKFDYMPEINLKWIGINVIIKSKRRYNYDTTQMHYLLDRAQSMSCFTVKRFESITIRDRTSRACLQREFHE